MTRWPDRRGFRGVVVERGDVPQVVAVSDAFRQQGVALGRGDKHAHVAVAHDVGDLLGLEQRVDRDEDASGGWRAEAGDDGFETLFQVDGDALAALQAEADDAVGEIALRRSQFGVTDRLFGEGERRSVGVTISRARDQVGEQKSVGHW